MKRLLFLIVVWIGFTQPLRAATPCCGVTAVDMRTSTVTAIEHSTGRTFEFHVANAKLLAGLHAGSPVYANFSTKQVSLDGKTPCCVITKITLAPPRGGVAAGPASPSAAAAPPAGPEPAARAKAAGQANPVQPCCNITGINTQTGIAAAKENATGRMFSFQVTDANLLKSLKIGQGVYANFRANQASLDGKTACCKIVSGLSAEGPAAAAPAAGARLIKPQASPSPAQTLAGAGALQVNQALTLPRISAGPPQRVDTAAARSHTAAGLGAARGNRIGGSMLRLRGMAGIKNATSLPEGARELLLMHARTLGAGELDDYIVNPQLAEEWMKTHPAPASAKAATSGDKHTGCKSISIHCAQEAGKHAVDEASRQSEKFLKQAREEWKHVSDEATHDWHMTEGCFEDHKLTLPDIPVQFSIVPEISLDAEKSGSTSNKYGSASGTVKGTVAFGIPLDADFKAQLDLFYIPCLPFAVRPRSLGADGSLVSGSRLGATLTATGKFNQHFMIPPSGGPHFPIEIIPIVIAGVPVAELDISVYVDGTLDLDGEGRLDSSFTLEAKQKTNFDFECSGKGCKLRSHTAPLPKTASEAVKLQGRLHVKPAVYVALQLDFDVDLLSARAGPQPYLLGELYGCGAASAAQTQGGPSTMQEFYALTADLDWGIELRAEALVANKIVAEAPRIQLVPADKKHLYFKDLANSTALLPGLAGTLQPSAGQPASYKTKMPDCYPYTDPVEYHVNWTGGATATSGSASSAATGNKALSSAPIALSGKKPQPAAGNAPTACTIQPGQGDCWSDPLKDVSLDLAWPAAGAYSLTVTPVRDKHGRIFTPEKPAELDVTVQP